MSILIIAFIASLITFSITVAIGIVCFSEMKQDLIKRSAWLLEPLTLIFKTRAAERAAEARWLLALAVPANAEILKSNDNHKPIQSFKT